MMSATTNVFASAPPMSSQLWPMFCKVIQCRRCSSMPRSFLKLYFCAAAWCAKPVWKGQQPPMQQQDANQSSSLLPLSNTQRSATAHG